jgi:hypothetical protein
MWFASPKFSSSHLYSWAKGKVLHLCIETCILCSFESFFKKLKIKKKKSVGDGSIKKWLISIK